MQTRKYHSGVCVNVVTANSADLQIYASSETVYARAPLLGRTFCIVNTAPELKAREIFRI